MTKQNPQIEPTSSSSMLAAVQSIYDVHKKKLDTIKENRAKWEEENWTDIEVKSADDQIAILASILSDLYRNVLHIDDLKTESN